MCADGTSCHEIPPGTYIDWTVELVASFIRNNSLSASGLQDLISATYQSLTTLNNLKSSAPAVAVGESVQEDYLICLEDGKKLKALRRHLRRAFNLTPEEYRRKWHLPDDYPMVAPAYSRARSKIARRP